MPAHRRPKGRRAKATKSKKSSTSQSTLDPTTFNGLHLDPDPNRRSVRHVALPEKPTVKTLKPLKRAKEGKVLHDLERLLLNMLDTAVKNKVVLPFRMSELRKARDSSKGVPIQSGGPFGRMGETETILRAADGPRLVVDLADEVVYIYLPGIIGSGLQSMIQDALDVVVARHPPTADKTQGDRRSSVATSHKAAAWGSDNVWPSLRRGTLAPSAYYWSAGWYGTGQENVADINVSVPFLKAMNNQQEQEVAHVQEARRIYDHIVRMLVKIIHGSLDECMRRLLHELEQDPGVVGQVAREGWTSSFPCVAFAFNRESGKHRDTNGLRHGMDVIGVLGSFVGGPLKFQDLNMTVEWGAGCMGAFDGYDLTHEVLPWQGSHRIALISFCRSSTWRGLGLSHNATAPTLSRLVASLAEAKVTRKSAIAEALVNLPKKPSVIG
ncbi:hypothetical protein FRC08_008359 [Ceratobasidium sp. 394]|nr:hypothetical protein FRC08_008359 [Ceratobasidium sp. 394]